MITKEDAERRTEEVIRDCLKAIKQKKKEVRSQEDPLASARYRGLCQQEHRLRGMSEGLSFISIDEAAVLLECAPDEVEAMRQEGQLLGVSFYTEEYLYPKFQFSEGAALPGCEEILSALAENTESPHMWVQFFIVRSPWMPDTERPKDYLRNGGDPKVVVEAARNFLRTDAYA